MNSKWALITRIAICTMVLAAVLQVSYFYRVFHVTAAESEDMAIAKSMGHLETRNGVITILVGEHGHYYTVKTKDGATLADRIPERQFKLRFNRAYNQLNRGYAGNLAIY
jgi:uncharacterized protein YpmB